MAQQCLLKDANHLCGEDAVSSVVVGKDRDALVDVPACERHLNGLLSSAQAATWVKEVSAEPPAPATIAEAAESTPTEPAA